MSEWAACLLRRVSLWLCLTRCPALLTCLLARLQFISLWSAARYRSDHALHPARLLPPGPVGAGIRPAATAAAAAERMAIVAHINGTLSHDVSYSVRNYGNGGSALTEAC